MFAIGYPTDGEKCCGEIFIDAPINETSSSVSLTSTMCSDISENINAARRRNWVMNVIKEKTKRARRGLRKLNFRLYPSASWFIVFH